MGDRRHEHPGRGGCGLGGGGAGAGERRGLPDRRARGEWAANEPAGGNQAAHGAERERPGRDDDCRVPGARREEWRQRGALRLFGRGSGAGRFHAHQRGHANFVQ